MYAKSMVAILAALATFGFLATSVQAGPPLGAGGVSTTSGSALTRVDCQLCQVIQEDDDDDDDGSDMLDTLMLVGELL
jgi:hypothetical protein